MVAVGLIVLALTADPPGPPVQVAGATTCPAPADVEAALAGLIPPKDADAAADVAHLTDDAGSVVVALRRASGEPIGDKRLEPDQSCAERARAAAVVIAAWEARLAPQAVALVVAPRAPAPAATPVVQAAAPAPPPAPLRLEPGVGGGVSINGTTLAPAATIELAFSRPGAAVIPAVSGLLVGAHERAVGAGTATWRRYGVTATAASRRTWSSAWVEGRTGIALTVLDISGGSYPRNGSGVTIDPGVLFGFRAGVRAGPVRWWLDATVALWPRGQDVYVQGAPGSATLPRGGALLGIGASYEGH